MIITNAPFRISFAGGGSDLPAFYRQRRGAVLSVTINRYIYIIIHPYFNNHETLLKYSKNEFVERVDDIAHPLFREALKALWPQGGVEIVSTADVPSGTGLGSSSTFSVALLHALHSFRGAFRSKQDLAREAAELEIDRLHEPIGKQDHYAAAFGGLNLIEFNPDDTVVVSPVIIAGDVARELEDNLMLFYLGDQRAARDVLKDQVAEISTKHDKMDNLQKMVDLAYAMRETITQRDLTRFAQLMHEGWMLKRTLSSKISNPRIDAYYARARDHGALGGKLLGAGGGGFLLMYCERDHQAQLRDALSDLDELPFRFDWVGTRLVHVGENYVNKGFVK